MFERSEASEVLVQGTATKTYDFSKYHYIWFYRLSDRATFGYFLKVFFGSLAAVLVIAAAVFGIAYHYHILELVLSFEKSWPIYVGLTGIFLFILLFGLIAPYCFQIINSLGDLFEISNEDYEASVDRYIGRALSTPWNLLSFLLIGVPLLIGADYLWTQVTGYSSVPKEVLALINWMPDRAWYAEPLLPKLSIINLIGVFVVFSVLFSVRAFFVYIGLMRHIGTLRLKSMYIAPMAAVRFRALAGFNMFAAACYSIGILLVFTIADLRSPIVVAGLAVLILLSILIVVVPYLFLVRRLSTEKALLLEDIMSSYQKAFSSEDGKGPNLTEFRDALEVMKLVKDMPTGLYQLQLGLGNAIVTAGVAIALSYFKLSS